MKLEIVALLLGVQAIASDESVNLRGAQVASHPADAKPFETQETVLKAHEQKLTEYIGKLYKFENFGTEAGDAANKLKPLLVSGNYDPVADLDYDGFLISRQYKNRDCSGEVTSVVGKNLNCRPMGQGLSAQFFCDSSEGSTHMVGYLYGNLNCSGSILTQREENQWGCNGGVKTQCVQTARVQNFAKKEGLMTYKFKSWDDCVSFGQDYLGYYPYGTSTEGQFDDDYIGYDQCCTLEDKQNGCPYQLCPGEEGGGEGDDNGPPLVLAAKDHRGQVPELSETVEAVKPHAAQLSAEEVEARHAWWEKQLEIHNTEAAAANAKKAAAQAQSAPEPELMLPTNAKEAQEALTHDSASDKDALYVAPNREFAFTQLRNQICTYDEKYGLYVKTSCYGKSNKMVYFVFLDSKCKKAVKRTVHSLDEAIPGYGRCAQSQKDNRVSLTICHNTAGSDIPEYASWNT